MPVKMSRARAMAQLDSTLETLRPRPLPHHAECYVCGATSNLTQCKGCDLVCFCPSYHHHGQRRTHAKTCSDLLTFTVFQDNCQRLMDQLEGDSTANAVDKHRFATLCRQQWLLQVVLQLAKLGTRSAMKRAVNVAEAFVSSATSAVDYGYRTVELFRPLIYMRLGLDQMAHDLTRRILSRDVPQQGPNDSIGRMLQLVVRMLAALREKWDQLRPEDQATHVFEKLEFIPDPDFGKNSVRIMNYAHLILHKIKALLCLQSMDNVDLIASRLPPELLCRIQLFMTTTTMTSCAEFKRQVTTGRCLDEWKISLEEDIQVLFDYVDGSCGWFWPLMAKTSYLRSPANTWNEVTLPLFGMVYAVFVETPGTLEWIIAYIQERIPPEEVAKREHRIIQGQRMPSKAYEKENASSGRDEEDSDEEQIVDTEDDHASSDDDEADNEADHKESDDQGVDDQEEDDNEGENDD